MRFYDRETEIEILKENELQSRKSAVFSVLMGRKRVAVPVARRTGTTRAVASEYEPALRAVLQQDTGAVFPGAGDGYGAVHLGRQLVGSQGR